MDLHRLRIFTSVFQHRSFSKASVELHLSQPTVSEHIRALEEQLQCRLFDRLGRAVYPTKEAELLYPHGLEVLEKAAALQELVLNYQQDISGDLIIGASSIPGTYLLPSIIALFHKKYPHTSFQIIISDSGDVMEKLLQHQFLLGIVGTKYNHDQINFSPFMEDELIVISAPSAIKEKSLSLNELVNFPMVLREKGSGTRREFEKILEREAIPPDEIKVAGIFSSTEAVKQAVKAGLGFSILSRLAVRDELARKNLQQIKIKNLTMKRSFYAVTHQKRSLPPVYQLFLKQLVK